MAKWDKELEASLAGVECVIEVRDARLPLASAYPQLEARLKGKPRLLILNKADVADPVQTQRWLALFAELPNVTPLAFCAKTFTGPLRQALINHALTLTHTARNKTVAKGLKPRPAKLVVMGFPNVGKSSLINALVQKSRCTVGHKAGVTRQTQWLRLHPQLQLMDSPGLLPPKLPQQESALWLAMVSAIGDKAYDDEEAAQALLNRLEVMYPQLLTHHYDLPPATNDEPMTLAQLAMRRGWLLKGGLPDVPRASRQLLHDAAMGHLGAFSLEWPECSLQQLPTISPVTL
jgi:ribosome biogenesis GTPase A